MEAIKQKIFFTTLYQIKTDFSRYNYFYANYLDTVGENSKAKKIIEISLESPRNLLISTKLIYKLQKNLILIVKKKTCNC